MSYNHIEPQSLMTMPITMIKGFTQTHEGKYII